MGCDIHLHIEVKIDGKWEHYGCPDIHRNYLLFGVLAGVRNEEVIPVSYPKGLPNDITKITKMHYYENWKHDAHSHSWLNRGEIIQLNNAFQLDELGDNLERDILKTHLFGNGFADELPKGIEDVRFVFWFDN